MNNAFKSIVAVFLLLFSAALCHANMRYEVHVAFSEAQAIHAQSGYSVAYACLLTGSDAVLDLHTGAISYVNAHTGQAWADQQNAEYYDTVYFYVLGVTGNEAFAVEMAGMFVPWDQLIGMISDYMDVE